MAAKLSKGGRTRERILQAAEGIFARLGYESATLREVARLAGVQQPGIYNYFKTKRELYKAVLNRMMHPLVAALEDTQHVPATNRARSTTRLVDLMSENRNISSLLVRAFLSTNQTERDIAVKWMMRVMAASPSTELHRSGMRTRSIPEILKDMAVLNAWLGYFWTAPIMESVTGKKITDASLLEAQKDLLIYMIAKL